jgi:hypothetical protein
VKRILIVIVLGILLSNHSINGQKLKFGVNFTYDLYTNLDEIDGIKSSWKTLYTYNSGTYFYDVKDRYWPYDQLNMDISMQLGNKAFVIEPFWSFTIVKGWYSVSYDDGKYVADEAVLYLTASESNPVFIDGEEYLYARGSGRLGQKRFGSNLLLGDEVQIGFGIWWQKQKIELHKSMAYNRYWYNGAYSKDGLDAYVTYEDEIYVQEPRVENIYKNRFIFPLIFRYEDGPFSSHFTIIFQKPFQMLVGCGIYF